MNKSQLVKIVMDEKKMKKKEAKVLVDLIFDNISEALANGQKVQLHGFGNFEVKEYAPRKGRNPQTGEQIEIEASRKPAFKPAKGLKKVVNG